MEGTKSRTVSSLGMFDMLKGVGMLMVVFAHTAELYPIDLSGGVSFSTFLLFIYREALMSAFYIASGYGFRQRSVGKCIQQQCKGLLKPYLYTALATGALHLALHYAFFGYLPGALTETARVLGGFALGLPHTASYFGVSIFSCGPMWYLITLVVGWILLDLLLNIFPERYINWAVLATMILGWATCLVWELPFCLSQGMTVVPYLYLGYLTKKRRWLERPLPRWCRWVLPLCVLAAAVGACVAHTTDSMPMGQWALGPFGILINGAIGFWAVYGFTRWKKGDGPVVRALEGVGRRSLLIFCVHTVEVIAVPWYLFAARFDGRPLLGLAVQYALSLALIGAVCALLVCRRQLADALLPSRHSGRYVSRH